MSAEACLLPLVEDVNASQAGENWVGSPKMAQIRRRLKVAKVGKIGKGLSKSW